MGRVFRALILATFLLAMTVGSTFADTDLDGYQIGSYDGWNDYTWNYGYGDSGSGGDSGNSDNGGGGWDTGMGVSPEWS